MTNNFLVFKFLFLLLQRALKNPFIFFYLYSVFSIYFVFYITHYHMTILKEVFKKETLFYFNNDLFDKR